MKKTFIFLLGMVLFSCNKSTPETKTFRNELIVNTQSNGTMDSTVVASLLWKKGSPLLPKEIHKYDYQYEAYDGSVANVTFTHTPTESFILIERNKLKIELPKVQENAKMVLFEKDGIKAKVEGLHLELSQGEEAVELTVKP